MAVNTDGSDKWLEALLKAQNQFATERCKTCGHIRPDHATQWNQACPICRKVSAARLELSDMLVAYAKKQTPRVDYTELKEWVLELTDDDLVLFMDEIQRLAWKYDTKRSSPEFQRVFSTYYEALTGPLGGRILCLRSESSNATQKEKSSAINLNTGRKHKSKTNSATSQATA